jgi:hypothetical protein
VGNELSRAEGIVAVPMRASEEPMNQPAFRPVGLS